jgi:hypothetical protein
MFSLFLLLRIARIAGTRDIGPNFVPNKLQKVNYIKILILTLLGCQCTE